MVTDRIDLTPQPPSHLSLPSPPLPTLSYKEREKEEYFYLRGKRKDIFIRKGENIILLFNFIPNDNIKNSSYPRLLGEGLGERSNQPLMTAKRYNRINPFNDH